MKSVLKTDMTTELHRLFEFGRYRLLPEERLLLREDQPVTLPPKAFDTLVILVENSGHVVKKDELISRVWPDAYVDENNLNQYISLLRKTLNDAASGGYIETVRGYGYRFTADVHRIADHDQIVTLSRRSRTHIRVHEEAIEQGKYFETSSNDPAPATRPPSRMAGSELRRRPLVIGLFTISVLSTAFGVVYISRQLRGSRPATPANSSMPGRRPLSANAEALAAYHRGRELWNRRTRHNMLKAQREFQTALTLDPNFAAAYAGLADCLLLGGNLLNSLETADGLARKALAIDDSCAEAHTSLAYYKSAVEWDWNGAEIEFQRAIALDPQYATARHWHAYNLASLGRLDDALKEILYANRLDPASLVIATDIGHMLYLSKKYDQAIGQYLSVLLIDPNFGDAHFRLAEAYIQKGQWEDALRELQEAERIKKGSFTAWRAYAQARANRREEALRLLQQLKPQAEAVLNFYQVAIIYAALEDSEASVDWLEKSLQHRDGLLALVKVDPMLEPIHGDARYADLLRRMNLEPN